MGYQVSKKIWCTLRILHIFWQEDRNRICLCTSAEVVVLILNRHEPQQFQVKWPFKLLKWKKFNFLKVSLGKLVTICVDDNADDIFLLSQ